MRPVEQDVFDGALLVLIALGGVHRGFRQLRSVENGAGQLPPQQQAALIVDEALLGGLVLTQQHVEDAVRSNWPVGPRKSGLVVIRRAISASEMPSRSAFTRSSMRRFADELSHQLLVEAHGLRLIERDRAAELTAELLQPLAIELAELLDRDLGAADPRQVRTAKTAKNVADAPDREADRDQAEHDAHHDSAEPIGGGGANTSKHVAVSG